MSNEEIARQILCDIGLAGEYTIGQRMVVEDALDTKDFEHQKSFQLLTIERDAEVKRARQVEKWLNEASTALGGCDLDCVAKQVAELKAERDNLQKRLDFRRNFDGDCVSCVELKGRVEELERINSNANKVFGADCDGLQKVIASQEALLNELAGACEAMTSYWEHGKLTVNGDYMNGCARKALTKYNSWKGSKG